MPTTASERSSSTQATQALRPAPLPGSVGIGAVSATVTKPMLMRTAIGECLRDRRRVQGKTLREISAAARISLGYLSEVERGQKEPSSELLAAICDALGIEVSALLSDVSAVIALDEQLQRDQLPVPAVGGNQMRLQRRIELPGGAQGSRDRVGV